MCNFSVLLTYGQGIGQGCEIVTKMKVDQDGNGRKLVQGFAVDVP